MLRKEKEASVESLTEKLKDTNGIVLTEYHGLTVEEISELRNKLRPLKCDYKVVKNTLVQRALENLGMTEFSKQFTGPSAIAVQRGDAVSSAKALVDFSKDHAKLKIKSGFMGNKMLSLAQIRSLASLPSREVLLAKMLGSMMSPINGIVNVLHGNLRNMVNVLDAIRKQKEAIK